MLAETEAPTVAEAGNPIQVAAAANRVLASQSPGAVQDGIPDKADAARLPRALRMDAALEADPVLDGWKKRPAHLTPYASWSEALAAWEAAEQGLTDTFRVHHALSTTFIKDLSVDPGVRNDYIFSRTIADALVKQPNLPADLVAAHRAYEAAKEHRDAVRTRAVQTPATGAQIIQKLRLITGDMDDIFDPMEGQDVLATKRRPDEFPLALEFFALHDDLGRALSQRLTPAWEAAAQRLKNAKAALAPLVAADRVAVETINRQAPAETIGRSICQDHSCRWLSDTCVAQDVLLTHAERQRLAPAVAAWQQRRSELLSENSDPAADAEWERLYNEVHDAELALLEAEPPGLIQLVEQQRIMGQWSAEQDNDSENGFDNLGWVAFRAAGYWDGRTLVAIHRNTLRLAGIDHPMLHMPSFSPIEWVNQYENTGGKVSHSPRGLILTIPEDDTAAAALREQLRETPWKFWAVQLEASRRREEGGDPIYDAYMGSGHADRRGGSLKFFGTVALADLVEFSRDPEGGAPLAHICRIDNRGQG